MMAALAISASAQIAAPPAPAGSNRLDDAKILITNGKYLKAIPLLESIVSSDKASTPQALEMMGDCYKAQQNWSKAIECFQKRLADYPNSGSPERDVKSWMMDCYLANNDLTKGLALRNELLAQYGPDAWRIYYIVGWRYAWLKKFAEAESELEKAIEGGILAKTDDDVIDANRLLLVCCVVRSQWDKADKLAQRLLKDYPDKSYEWNYQIGKSYQARQEYAKALEALEPAAKLAPDKTVVSKNIYKTMLDCYDETDRLDKAIPLAEKLVGDYPGESAWQWRLGWYYLTKQQYEKAAPLFEQVIKSSKADWEIRKALIFRGQCLYALGKGPDALEMVETYFKDKPAQWDDHLLIKAGVLYYGPRDDAGCVSALTELLAQADAGKKSTLVLAARELMCRALTRKGDLAEAGSVMERMAVESKNLLWLCGAGDNYFKAGNYKEAKRLYKEVLDQAELSDEIRPQCMYGLALCYWETGLKAAGRRLAGEVCERYQDTPSAEKARTTLYLWSKAGSDAHQSP